MTDRVMAHELQATSLSLPGLVEGVRQGARVLELAGLLLSYAGPLLFVGIV